MSSPATELAVTTITASPAHKPATQFEPDAVDLTSSRLGWSRKQFLLCLMTITLLGGAMRVHQLAEPSLWIDELFTIRSTALIYDGQWNARTLAYIPADLGLRLAGINPAGVPAESYEQWRAMGIKPWVMRLPYCIVGILCIPILALLARPMLGSRVTLIFALLLAASPWHLWMSQLARFYTQQFLLYNVGLLLWYLGTRRDSRPMLAGAAICAFAAFWTQTGSIILLGVFAVDWLANRLFARPLRVSWQGLVYMLVAAGACGTVVTMHYLQEQHAYTSFEGSKQSAKHMLMALPYLVGVATTTVACLTAVWLLGKERRLPILLIVAATLPLIFFASLAAMGVDMHIRYVFVNLFAWLALASIGIDRLYRVLRTRAGLLPALAPLAILMATSLFSCYAYFDGGEGFRSRWSDAFAYIQAHRKPGEAVAADYIPEKIGRYYLQTDDVTLISTNINAADLENIDKPTWFVFRGHAPTGGRRYAWLHDQTDFKAYFATRILQPYSSIHIYYYTPATSE